MGGGWLSRFYIYMVTYIYMYINVVVFWGGGLVGWEVV